MPLTCVCAPAGDADAAGCAWFTARVLAVMRRDLAEVAEDWELLAAKAVRWLGTVTEAPEALITMAAGVAV